MPHSARRTSGSCIGLFLVLGFLLAGDASRAASCADGNDGVCLGGGRFRVDAVWVASAAGEGASAEALGPDAAWFRSPAGDTLVVALIDGRAVNGHFWVLSGTPSDARYNLTVTDLESGAARDYSEVLPANDVRAFAAVDARRNAPQESDSTASLLLEQRRLKIEMTGTRARRIDAHSGVVWSDDPTRPDVVSRVVDGRALGGELWLLVGSPSGAAGALRVTDLAARRSFAVDLLAGDSSIHMLALPGPRAVTVTLDRTRSASAIVPVGGGTLTATAANGTVFTLIVPAGALLSEQKIMLTPVVSVGGLPFHPGLVGAVHLEPEGLRLFKAATLRIKPLVAVPRAQEMTFAYRGTGKEFFLFPPTVAAAGVEMKLLHFSGYGVAKGSLTEQTAQLLRLPTRAEDRLSQKLQAIVSKKRRGGKTQAAAAPQDFSADLEQAMRDTYNTSIKPNLVPVTTNCTLFKKQIPLMLGWSRQAQLLGLSEFDDEVAGILDVMEKGTANCYNESFGKCVNQHDPLQVTNMFSYLRILTLFGAQDLVDEDRIEKCVRFDLNFESDVEYHTLVSGAGGVRAGFRMKLRTKVPLRFDGIKVSGSAPFEWLSATWTGVLPPGVTVAHVGPGAGSTFTVVNLGFDLNVYEGAPPPPQIRLTYDPGQPQVSNSFTFDSDPPTTIDFPDFAWRPPYDFLHQDEIAPGGLTARDWSLVGGAVWARKTYQRSRATPEVTADETTLMDLIHTPQP